jgi:hypothetical protein
LGGLTADLDVVAERNVLTCWVSNTPVAQSTAVTILAELSRILLGINRMIILKWILEK